MNKPYFTLPISNISEAAASPEAFSDDQDRILAHAQKVAIYNAMEDFFLHGAEYKHEYFEALTKTLHSLPFPLPLEAFGMLMVFCDHFSEHFKTGLENEKMQQQEFDIEAAKKRLRAT